MRKWKASVGTRMARISTRRKADKNEEMEMLKCEAITERIIGAFYHVYNTLGWGFLEKVYQNSLAIEFGKRGLRFVEQAKIEVRYEGHFVGEYFADFLVEDAVIVELKACEQLAPEHETQVLNYLKASAIDVGLLLHFGPKPQFRRRIFESARPTILTHTFPTQPISDPR